MGMSISYNDGWPTVKEAIRQTQADLNSLVGKDLNTSHTRRDKLLNTSQRLAHKGQTTS